ncbi:MAG: 50S ribosomal protein L27 [Chloroflexi bacterium]|nr:MAG: 50S ribosomal protein L27 [Chloroflexota bacterium]TMD53909.1 MAG: 50S ribosomal protein L27 [Chloroflexota bacterium]
MAHKKGGGSSRNGRDSNPQNLGVKVFGGQIVSAGSILVRQRGSHISAGPGAAEGRDHTIFAMISGEVGYQRDGRTGRQATVKPTQAKSEAAG